MRKRNGPAVRPTSVCAGGRVNEEIWRNSSSRARLSALAACRPACAAAARSRSSEARAFAQEAGGVRQRLELLQRREDVRAAVGSPHLALGVGALGGEQAGAVEVEERRQVFAAEAAPSTKARTCSTMLQASARSAVSRSSSKRGGLGAASFSLALDSAPPLMLIWRWTVLPLAKPPRSCYVLRTQFDRKHR